MTTAAPRRRAGQRISAVVWGLLVIGAGVLSMYAYSGYAIDLELAAIILLAGLGGWLLLSAAVSGIGRRREIARATAPTVEERVHAEPQPEQGASPATDDLGGADDAAPGGPSDTEPVGTVQTDTDQVDTVQPDTDAPGDESGPRADR